jgi:hypothetical protein
MAAIITSHFRLNNAKAIVADIAAYADGVTPAASRYYIGLGKSDQWNDSLVETVQTPNTGDAVLETAKKNLVALCLITTASLVVPRINWRGTATPQIFKTYNRWDASTLYTSTSGGTTYNAAYAYYDSAIYICTKAGAGTSTVAPSTNATVIGTIGAAGGDGYEWVKVCAVDTTSKLFQRDFVPVPSMVGSNTASAGSIYGFTGTLTGSGAQTVYGDGSSAAMSVTGQVLTISNKGSGYIVASMSGQTTATLLVAPIKGFGAVPSEDLPAWYVSTAADFQGSEDGKIPVSNDYRQISLIKGATVITPATLLAPIVPALKCLNIGTGTFSGLLADVVITGANGAKGYVSHTGSNLSAETLIYYHQNETSAVNCKAFAAGALTWSGGSGTVASLIAPNYTPGTGTVLFLENRTPITRSETQVEQVRLVVQF